MFPFAESQAAARLVHAGLEAFALAVGARVYLGARRRSGAAPVTGGRAFWILLGCLAGAAVGNKAVAFVDRPFDLGRADALRLLYSGQSMVGGLLGGLLGTEAAKALVGERRSTGDLFVFPVLLGLAIGRVGCFLAGLHDGTFGSPAALPWSVDFGDGVPRHPTQLYEVVFAGALAAALHAARGWARPVPGLLFKLRLTGYLAWRLAVDSLKPVPYPWPLGLSGIQWTCLVALTLYAPLLGRALRSRRHAPPEPALPLP
jgi:prolipoprotein diacylglyceryltransferase